MKIKELIAELEKIENKEQEVYLSSDSEGNNYHTVDGVYNRYGWNNAVVIYPTDTTVE